VERREQTKRRIFRRCYSSPFPHYCWHIDGNHKLIRWGIVVHCAIDGHSRLCTFLKCSNNNRSTTVYEYFVMACEEVGYVPVKVRTDYGGENQLVWKAMVGLKNDINKNPVILGSSVHNQRVERFNREINTHIRARYARIFYALERNGKLNIDDPICIAALHFVYIPRINQVLDNLKACHNHHPIRTEGNLTPLQLVAKSIHLYNSNGASEPLETVNSELPDNPTTVPIHAPIMDVNEDDNFLNSFNVHLDDGADGQNLYDQVKLHLQEIILQR